MGFAKGFAQGWSAEMDRQERRREFQAALQEKRIATIGEIISRRAALGLTSSTSSGGEGDSSAESTSGGGVDANHYSNVLVNYGMEPDTVAKIAAKGPYALKAAANTIENNPDAIWTPETFAKFPDAIVVTQRETGKVDADGIITQLYGPEFLAQMDPVDRELIDLMGTPAPQAPIVSNTLRPPEPINVEMTNQVINAANSTLVAELTARKEEADAQAQAATEAQDVDAAAAAAEKSAYYAGLITEVGENNIVPAIREVGKDIIGPYLENNPQLKARPEILGPWASTAQEYLKPAEPEGPKSYTSAEEVQADIDAGILREGDIVIINGKEVPIRFGD